MLGQYENFSEAARVLLLNAEDALSAAKYPLSGSFIDMEPYKRAVFIVGAGALDTAVVLQVEEATAADGTPSDVSGATVTIPTDGDDEPYIIEVDNHALTKRFITLDVTGPTGNDYGAILCLLFAEGEKPVDQINTPVVKLG